MLRERGHEVVVADNGQEALDKLAGESFDAILMDVQMPVLDIRILSARLLLVVVAV